MVGVTKKIFKVEEQQITKALPKERINKQTLTGLTNLKRRETYGVVSVT